MTRTIKFEYRKYDPLPTKEPFPMLIGAGLYVKKSADWIVVYVRSSFPPIPRVNSPRHFVSLANSVNYMEPGKYKTTFSVWDRIRYPDRSISDVKRITATVELILKDAILSLSTSAISFSYINSNALPKNQRVNVISSRKWKVSKDKFWISLPSTSGKGKGSFEIGVIPQGLSIGTHTGIVKVNDGLLEKTVAVSLVISEEPVDNQFLFVSPKRLFFNYVLSGNLPARQTIGVQSSGIFYITISHSWIRTSIPRGDGQTKFIEVFLNETAVNELPEGSYNATIQVKQKDIIHVIEVFLKTFKFIGKPIEGVEHPVSGKLPISGKIYYVKDNNQILVSSDKPNSYLHVFAKTIDRGLNFNAQFSVPFFQGVAKKHIGDFAERVFAPSGFQLFQTPVVYSPYLPVRVDYDMQEKELYANISFLQSNLTNVGFLKGHSPTPSLVHSKIPKTLFLTKQGVVSFGFRLKNNGALTIYVTGNIKKKIPIKVQDNDIFNFYFPLNHLQNLKRGNKIRVSVGDIGMDVIVRGNGINHSLVFWENQWGCWDCFECTGTFVRSKKYKQIISKTATSHELIKTNVHDVKKTTLLTVNTGFILSDGEVIYLEDMLNSKNIVLMNEGEVYYVRSTTKSLKIKDTERNMNSFDLDFEIVEE